jgi:hypothetical protein
MNQYPILSFITDKITVLAGPSEITGSLYLQGAIDQASASVLGGTVVLSQDNALNVGGLLTSTFLDNAPNFYVTGAVGSGVIGGNVNILGLGTTTDSTPTTSSGVQFLTQWRGIYGPNQPVPNQIYNTWMGYTYEDSDPNGVLGPVFLISSNTQLSSRVNNPILEYRPFDNTLFVADQGYQINTKIQGNSIAITTSPPAIEPTGQDTVIQGNNLYLEGSTMLMLTGSELQAGPEMMSLLGGANYMLSYNTESRQIGVSPFPVADNGGIQSETDPIFTSVRYTLASTGSNTFTAQQRIYSATQSGSLVISGSKGGEVNFNDTNGLVGQLYVTQSNTFLTARSNTLTLSGSRIVASGITSSLFGTASWATNAVSASSIAFTNITGTPSIISSSAQVDVTQTLNYSTLATTGSNSLVGNQTITGSLTVSGSNTTIASTLIQLQGQSVYVSGGFYAYNSTTPDRSGTYNYSIAVLEDYGDGTSRFGTVTRDSLGLNTGSLSNTSIAGTLTVTGSTIMSGSAAVTGAFEATSYTNIGLTSLPIPPNTPILYTSMLSQSGWYGQQTSATVKTGLANFFYSSSANANNQLVVVFDGTTNSMLDLTTTDFVQQNEAYLDEIYFINSTDRNQSWQFYDSGDILTIASIGSKNVAKVNVFHNTAHLALSYPVTLGYARTDIPGKTVVNSTTATVFRPVTSITNYANSPFSSSAANKIPQGTVYFNSSSATLDVATFTNVTRSLVTNVYTGSLHISGGLSTFNFVSGTLITPTGSFTTPTPTFAASEGQFLFGSGSNGYAMFVWIGGGWRSSSLA